MARPKGIKESTPRKRKDKGLKTTQIRITGKPDDIELIKAWLASVHLGLRAATKVLLKAAKKFTAVPQNSSNG